MVVNTVRNEIIDEMYSGFETAFINSDIASNVSYRPQFISNNYKEGKRVNCWEDTYNKLSEF